MRNSTSQLSSSRDNDDQTREFANRLLWNKDDRRWKFCLVRVAEKLTCADTSNFISDMAGVWFCEVILRNFGEIFFRILWRRIKNRNSIRSRCETLTNKSFENFLKKLFQCWTRRFFQVIKNLNWMFLLGKINKKCFYREIELKAEMFVNHR